MRWRAQRTRFLVATLALLLVGAVLGGESLNHTDDGCAIEIHCLACRMAVGTTAVLPQVVIAPVGLELAGTVAPLPVLPAQDVVVAPDQSRAPPLA